MKQLLKQLESIDMQTRHQIIQRLQEFQSFKNKSSKEWLSELNYCILTANSKASTATLVQKELDKKGDRITIEEATAILRKHNHRFHNTKAERIIKAKEHKNIKEVLQAIIRKEGVMKARDWLVKHVEGIGMKEASHYLRNTGHDGLAILDRHIISTMKENGIIDEEPKLLDTKTYLELEKKFLNLSKKLNIRPAELDLTLWCLKSGTVLK